VRDNRWLGLAVAAALMVAAAPAAAWRAASTPTSAAPSDGAPPEAIPPELPVLHSAPEPGTATTTALPTAKPRGRTVDGSTDDWRGTPTGFGGTVVRSRGELIYTDHIFDAYGADDGRDAERLAQLEPLEEAVPETYRLEPLIAYDIPGELGLPGTEALSATQHYGDAGLVDVADILEVRAAADRHALQLLARTTTMHRADDTAVLVLLDTRPGSDRHAVPFGSGLSSDVAEIAVLLAGGIGRAVDLTTGASWSIATATDPTGWVNAVEAAIPVAVLGAAPGWGSAQVRMAVATGRFDPATGRMLDLPEVGANVANVAFRTGEPVTTWFDQRQALALLAGSIDEFFVDVDPAGLAAGADERWAPGPGYHDRIFVSTDGISSEEGANGIHQHYGVQLPPGYAPDAPAPMTMWLHWRGGKAHSAAAVSPRILRDQGDAFGGIVVSPRGRGTSTWYLGRGLVDVNEVWADALAAFAVDRNRVYVSGHSMGGWGSYLLGILYPDRFAGIFPVAGPVTQGAWTGIDFAGCDDLAYEEYTPCYISANESDPRTQHTRRLLQNLRNVPLAIYQGALDELVPVSGVTRQVEQLVELGYRHRYYLFPTYEHYTHPVVDEWMDGARYVHGFVRDPNPPRVTYVRDMPFERTVETGPSQERPTTGLSFSFDRAYWMSELTPVDAVHGAARFDGTSHALAPEPTLRVPEAGGPASIGQVGPFAMTGITWSDNPLTPTRPASSFAVTLAGARAVRLDLPRMGLRSGRIDGAVTTDHDLVLRLDGEWTRRPTIVVDDLPVRFTFADGVASVTVSKGSGRTITIVP
jgi:hypothetical protein